MLPGIVKFPSLLVLLGTGWLASSASLPLRAEDAAEPTKGFTAEKISITAGEIADELGYKFDGTTWHFSSPTYVRLKLWSVHGKPAETPEHPEKSLPPTQVIALDGPLKAVSLRLLSRNTEEASANPDDLRSHKLAFKVGFSGENAEAVDAQGGKNGLHDFVATLLSGKLTGIVNHDQTREFTYTEYLREHGDAYTLSTGFWVTGDLGGEFSHLQQLDDLAQQPDAEAKALALVTQWQAEAEKKLLEQPLKVYGYKGEAISREKERGVQERITFVLVLECSRQPFQPENPTASPAPTP